MSLTVVLDRDTVPADGAPIDGFVEVRNTTGAPIVIANDCNGFVEVALAGHLVLYGDGSFERRCADGAIPNGTSRIPIQVTTTYSVCLEPGGAAATPTPKCIGPSHHDMPPLPPGRYVTTSFLLGVPKSVPPPPPVPVTLLPATAGRREADRRAAVR